MVTPSPRMSIAPMGTLRRRSSWMCCSTSAIGTRRLLAVTPARPGRLGRGEVAPSASAQSQGLRCNNGCRDRATDRPTSKSHATFAWRHREQRSPFHLSVQFRSFARSCRRLPKLLNAGDHVSNGLPRFIRLAGKHNRSIHLDIEQQRCKLHSRNPQVPL
jgi:hypothetical protein